MRTLQYMTSAHGVGWTRQVVCIVSKSLCNFNIFIARKLILDSCKTIQQVQSWFEYWNYTVLRLVPSLWANLLPIKTENSVRSRGSRLHDAYSSVRDPDQALGFWSSKIALFWGLWAFDFQRVKGQIAAVCSWSIDFSNSWSDLFIGPQKAFD